MRDKKWQYIRVYLQMQEGSLLKSMIIVSSLMLFLCGCSILPKEEVIDRPPLVKPVKESFATANVKMGSISKQFTGNGVLISKVQQQLFFKRSGGVLKSVNVKIGDTVKKGQILFMLDSDELENEIYAQKAALEQAVILQQQAGSTDASDAVNLQIRQLDVALAQNQLDQLEKELAEHTLISPIDGVVTFLASVQPSETISTFIPLITISDPTQLQLTAHVDDPDKLLDLNAVEVGDKAKVIIAGNDYTGEVAQTPNSVAFTTDKVQQSMNSKTLLIRVDNLPASATLGTMASYAVTLAQKQNVLIIPRTALSSNKSQDFVRVVNGDSRIEVNVETGIVGSIDVEISKGLKLGQQVVIKSSN